MTYGRGPLEPPNYKRIREQAMSEDTQRRDRLKKAMGGGSIFSELWMAVKFVVTLPWRLFKWMRDKVAREERADRS